MLTRYDEYWSIHELRTTSTLQLLSYFINKGRISLRGGGIDEGSLIFLFLFLLHSLAGVLVWALERGRCSAFQRGHRGGEWRNGVVDSWCVGVG